MAELRMVIEAIREMEPHTRTGKADWAEVRIVRHVLEQMLEAAEQLEEEATQRVSGHM